MGYKAVENRLHSARVNQGLTICQQPVPGLAARLSRMPNTYKKETFATRLKLLRGEGRHKATYEEIAEIAAGRGKTPVSKQAVAKWFSGKAIPGPEALANMASHWQTTKEWLYFGDSPKSPVSMEIAKALDLLPEIERQEVARDIARRLDGVEDIPVGVAHDNFMTVLRAASALLKKYSKPSH